MLFNVVCGCCSVVKLYRLVVDVDVINLYHECAVAQWSILFLSCYACGNTYIRLYI